MSTKCRAAVAILALLSLACTRTNRAPDGQGREGSMAAGAAAAPAAGDTSLPPDAAGARARIAASPRHGEWVMIPSGAGDSVRAWVVYPERSGKAPVVVVVHEIFGLGSWVRATADQLASAGFIAIAPDLLTGKHVPQGGPDSVSVDSAVAVVSTLDPNEVQRRISAAARYATSLPAALPRYGVMGFCWGGGVAFRHAADGGPGLDAAVVFYGAAPPADVLAKVHAPVLAFYGGNDARVTSTIPRADSVLRVPGKTYEHVVFAGAGHGFMRAQSGQNGANMTAASHAWPRAIAWLHKYLGA